MIAEWTLAKRELVRFFRQRNRVIGAIGQPLIFWLLFGAGFRSTFNYPTGGMSFQEYFFPGTIALILLFTSIFSTFSLIEDRNEGFLQGVMVAPVKRTSIVLGKILGGTILALFQGLLFALIGVLSGIPLSLAAWPALLFVLVLVALGLTSLGFCFAWKMDSTAGFHAIMSIVLLPMWLLSGAFFPLTGAPTWLEWLMRLNPFTYGVSALRHSIYIDSEVDLSHLPSLSQSLFLTLGFSVFFFVLAWVFVNQREKGASP